MSLPLLDSPDDPSLDSAPGAAPAPGDTPDSGRGRARPRRSQASGPKTGPAKPARKSEAPAATPDTTADQPPSKLVLDLNAVADVDGLHQEVAVLRASIRQLASGGDDIAEHVKVLAELRHQIETLCRTLKTQQSLEGPDGDGRAAEMRRILEELGDQLEVKR